MIEENFSLTSREIKLLKKLVGKKIICIESVKYPDDDDFWWPIRIEADSTEVIICNDLTVANYFETQEDCGRLCIKEVDSVTLRAENDEKYSKQINRIVNDIIVVEDVITFHEKKGENGYRFVYPIAVVIKFDEDSLVFERGWLFQEYITIQLQDNSMINIRDELNDWFDPDEDEVAPEIIRSEFSLT